MGLTRNQVYSQGYRRFKSSSHRQFSEFRFWAITASPRQRRGSASAVILKGFLKSKNNFCPLKRKFESIFFRKFRPLFGIFLQSDNFSLLYGIYFELRNSATLPFHTRAKQPQVFLSQEQKFNFSQKQFLYASTYARSE